jgi:hypothetical protein
VKIKNSITKSYPIVFHINGGFENCKIGYDLFDNETMNNWNWNSTEELRDDVTLCFAKWGDESKFVCTLDDNLKRFNLSYLNIGENFDPTNFSYDESRVRKPHLLHENLNEVTTKYIMGWDVDIFFTDHPNRVVERFENEFDCEWLFNAENTCFPMTRPRRQAMGLYRKWKEHTDLVGDSPFKYLNSGLFIAKVDFFREIFEDIINTPLFEDQTDQGQFHQVYKKYFPQMQIDYGCRIFQSLYKLDEKCLEVSIDEL